MKKLAFTGLFALALAATGAAVFANASDVPHPALPSTPSVERTGHSDSSIPAQLLTLTCGQRQGDLVFSDSELNYMVDLALKEPESTPQVCKAFTKRV